MNKIWKVVLVIYYTLVIILAIWAFNYYYFIKINSCTSNPIIYGVNELRDNTNADISMTMSYLINGKAVSTYVLSGNEFKNIKDQQPLFLNYTK
jgi:uncharacterized protein YpmB